MPCPSHQIQYQGKDNAQNNAGGQREVKGGAFAAINNVAGQAANGQVHASGKDQDHAEKRDQKAKKYQDFAEISHSLSLPQLPLLTPEYPLTNLLLLTCVLTTQVWIRGKPSR